MRRNGEGRDGGERRERRGGWLPSFLSKLGLGASGAGGAGLGGAGLWGGLLATKAGLVALILAGSTVAAGIGVAIRQGALSLDMPGSSGVGSLFARRAPGGAEAASGSAQAQGSGLDFWSGKTSSQGEGGQAGSGGDGSSLSGQNEDPGAAGANAGPGDNGNGAGNDGVAGRAASLVPRQDFKNDSGSTVSGARLAADEPAPAQKRELRAVDSNARGAKSAAPARAKTAASTLAGTRLSALGQLRVASARSQQAATLYGHESSAYKAGQAFESRTGGSGGPGQPGAGGAGAGDGAGLTKPKTNPESSSRELPPTPEVKSSKDVTPWQSQVHAAIGALLTGMILLAIAGKLAHKASPWAPALAKVLAGVAAGLGALAMLLGGIIMGAFGQKAQGSIFLISGGILAAKAAIVLVQASKASAAANKGIGATAQSGSKIIEEDMKGGNVPNPGDVYGP